MGDTTFDNLSKRAKEEAILGMIVYINDMGEPLPHGYGPSADKAIMRLIDDIYEEGGLEGFMEDWIG
jgi:hypothetical protein